ncbi:MAG: non-heme iron oxygenase ferredoxin subunit [Acidiferrobacterales bacterium]
MHDAYIKVARTDDIQPGKMKRVEIAGCPVLVAQVNGDYYAVADTCTHEDASLSTGSLKGELVKCPLHGSRFNVITGEVLEEPAEENLKTYALRIDGDYIFVENPNARQA